MKTKENTWELELANARSQKIAFLKEDLASGGKFQLDARTFYSLKLAYEGFAVNPDPANSATDSVHAERRERHAVACGWANYVNGVFTLRPELAERMLQFLDYVRWVHSSGTYKLTFYTYTDLCESLGVEPIGKEPEPVQTKDERRKI